MRSANKVCLIGKTLNRKLFRGRNPIGEEIRIGNVPFEVIGVMARKGQNPMGQDQDDAVFIPYWTARRSVMGASRANARQVGTISVKVHEGEDMREAEENIRALMRQRHRLVFGRERQRGGERARYDQQPLEAYSMVAAALEAYRITGDSSWEKEARRAFNWFLGRNDLELPLYDLLIGGCHDGLHQDRVNLNQGAESTLSFLLALAEMRLSQNIMDVNYELRIS